MSILWKLSCFLCILACLAGAAMSEELRAGPWPKVVRVPGYESLSAGLYLPEAAEVLTYIPEVTAKADAGDVGAMYDLATMYRKIGGEEMARAVRWYRTGVENGDVASAIVLGNLFFPTPGASRREFEITPDLVNGFCWLAIGQSGLTSAANFTGVTQERGFEETEDIDEEFLHDLGRRLTRELETLELLLFPSERARVEEILAA